jgi:NAD(P)-dependent dehydrogenase (short-subunit alcohol dehydrogenase family)
MSRHVFALLGLSLLAGALPAAAQVTAAVPASGQRVAMVTGSTDGLGREVAIRLAESGAHVIVHGRNAERGAEVVAAIEAAGKGSARFYRADLASLADVRQLAAAIRRDYRRLDLLVNNAGVWLTTGDRQVSADGHEMHLAVNYLAGALLTQELRPLLAASAPSRVVNVASVAQNPMDFADPMLERGYTGGRGYGQSKLAQVTWTVAEAPGLAAQGITMVALHPATMMPTAMVRASGMPARATIDQGATAVMNAATSAELKGGEYLDGTRLTRANAQAYDAAAQQALLQLTRRLTGG